MSQVAVFRIASKSLRRYPGIPFLIGFLVSLAIAIALLSGGNASVADEFAIYAFLALLVGTIVQIAALTRTSGSAQKWK